MKMLLLMLTALVAASGIDAATVVPDRDVTTSDDVNAEAPVLARTPSVLLCLRPHRA